MTKEVIPTPVESCVDYLRFSTKTETAEHEAVEKIFNAFEMQEAMSGEPPRQFRMAQYNMTGYGDVSHGRLNKRGLFNVSGPLSHEVMEVMKDRNLRPRCTRADTKISVEYGKEAWEGATRRLTREAWERQETGEQRQGALCLYEGAGRGDTLYFGRRTDASFARIYQADKKHPERYKPYTLTFEVQHNKKTADVMFNMLASSANLHTCAGSSVIGRLLSVGVRESWRNVYPPSHVMQRKHKNSKEGTLKWVESGVRGAFLRAKREGWMCEFLQRLGFGLLTFEEAEHLIGVLEAQNNGYDTFGE